MSPRRGSMVNRGRAVHGEHIPSRVIREGPKRKTPEIISCWSMHMVSERFRHCVETLEPGVHQFFKVEILWLDGSFAAERYFMVVCNRLDAIDRGLTTMRLKGVLWEPVPGGTNEIVLDVDRCQGHHLWRDKHLISALFVSDELADALGRIGIAGMELRRVRMTE